MTKARQPNNGVEIGRACGYGPAMIRQFTSFCAAVAPRAVLSLALVAAPVGLLAGSQAWAQAKKAAATPPETKRLGSFKSWQAYQLDGKDGRICYLHGLPAKQEPASARRGEIYLLVTHKPAKNVRNEVSIFFGYTLKDKSSVEAVIDKDALSLFTHEQAAWARDPETDAKLVENFKRGRQLVVKGESDRGTKTTDTYDLSGFSDALKTIDKACGGPSS
ncbi:invasion associated locus B family protein [Ferrovibrio sp.]|uniref:invasion associated locus B family protein n=1 Tax=Ferrovibrio sp. TaxID=1917215 RepID=UPI0025B8A3C6|nr:invasion associated locus B family protein [Ferrovibrio sp.]MBX3453901.1 hypothetical protein [Ferrovibrio sp.]